MSKCCIFDWDCTITQYHHNQFIHRYDDFVACYRENKQYVELNNKYCAIRRVIEGLPTTSIDDIAISKLKNDTKITTCVDIFDDHIYSYIVELFFGIPRFFALRDMFHILYSNKQNIIILSNGFYNDIIKLLKILLYSRDDIYASVYIYSYDETTSTIVLYKNNTRITDVVYSVSHQKHHVLQNIYEHDCKIFYTDDDKTYNELFRAHNSGNHDLGTRYEYLGLPHNGSGLTLENIKSICNKVLQQELQPQPQPQPQLQPQPQPQLQPQPQPQRQQLIQDLQQQKQELLQQLQQPSPQYPTPQQYPHLQPHSHPHSQYPHSHLRSQYPHSQYPHLQYPHSQPHTYPHSQSHSQYPHQQPPHVDGLTGGNKNAYIKLKKYFR